MSHDSLRLWFATDIHGSTACFKKFLNLPATTSEPNVIILGGDITGKQLIPIVEAGKGRFSVGLSARDEITATELEETKHALTESGYYIYECDALQLKLLRTSQAARTSVYNRLAEERLRDWVALADQKLPPADKCLCIINAGNDDPLAIDAILDESTRIVRPEGKIVPLPCNYYLASTGYSNMTPWDCPRDVSEDDLGEKIAAMLSTVGPVAAERLIFNFHCPPQNTALDRAYRIDPQAKVRKPSVSQQDRLHVGSSAVRDAIETWKPVLALHGHVHESAGIHNIGRSVCMNPGTDYRSGKLRGAFAMLDQEGLVTHQLTYERDSPGNPEASFFKALLAGIPGLGKYLKTELERAPAGPAAKKIDTIVEGLAASDPPG